MCMGSGMGSLKCAWGSAKAPLACDTLATFFFFFKYSLFTMLCQFLLYSKVTQSYIYIHSFSYYLPSWFIPRDHSSLCCRVGLHCLSILLLLLSFFFFLGPHVQHMEVLQLGVELELQLPAYSTAMATPDLSHACNLHPSSWQGWILNPLREARDQTHILVITSWVCYCWATMGTPLFFFFLLSR